MIKAMKRLFQQLSRLGGRRREPLSDEGLERVMRLYRHVLNDDEPLPPLPEAEFQRKTHERTNAGDKQAATCTVGCVAGEAETQELEHGPNPRYLVGAGALHRCFFHCVDAASLAADHVECAAGAR